MLRIAVQSKGRLFEETMALFEESDIKLSSHKRSLLVQSTNFPVEVLYLNREISRLNKKEITSCISRLNKK